MRAKNIRIGTETHLRPAPVGRPPQPLQLAFRLAAFEHHAVERLLARNLHFHALRKRVGHGHTHPMQAARGLIDLRVELPAGVQHAHDHFQRRFLWEFRVRIDRYAAAVIGDRHETVRLHDDLDE